MNIFESVFRTLNKAKVQYVVVGGVAVNLHGYLRFTGDLDLLLLLEEKNLRQMEKAMQALGYQERLPISIVDLKDRKEVKKWLKEKNMRAFSFTPPKENPLQIDVIIEESLKFETIQKNRTVKKISGVSIPVISIDDLVKMKKKANRTQDLADLEALINLKRIVKKTSKPMESPSRSSNDLELLRHWKKISTKGKLNWLSSALYFGKLKKFD